MPIVQSLAFQDVEVATLSDLSDAELDALEYGVIGFDVNTVVHRYNALESRMAGLSTSRVLNQAMFTVVAPCMNNFMVAERFVEAAAQGAGLDFTLDYVLTLRMRPVKVRLRLLAAPEATLRYVLVQRSL